MPLGILVNIGPVNFPIKLHSKITCTLETDMSKLFESNAKASAITQGDTKIIWQDEPFIQFKQIRLNDNLKEYLEKKVGFEEHFPNGHQKYPLRKVFQASCRRSNVYHWLCSR